MKMEDFKQIDIHEAKKILANKQATLIDIRDPTSFQEAHIQNAILVTEENINSFLRGTDKNQPLICYCYHGFNSQNAAEYFLQNGFKKVYTLKGGFEEWRAAYPFVS